MKALYDMLRPIESLIDEWDRKNYFIFGIIILIGIVAYALLR